MYVFINIYIYAFTTNYDVNGNNLGKYVLQEASLLNSH